MHLIDSIVAVLSIVGVAVNYCNGTGDNGINNSIDHHPGNLPDNLDTSAEPIPTKTPKAVAAHFRSRHIESGNAAGAGPSGVKKEQRKSNVGRNTRKTMKDEASRAAVSVSFSSSANLTLYIHIGQTRLVS